MAAEFEFPSPTPDPGPDSGRRSYDVFLSFRGKDTRHTFTSHLYRALIDVGVNAFFDAVELPRGEAISSQLQQAIRTSRFAVVILSTKYAESKWCLQELEEIMKWKQAMGQVVLPVFYGSEPSDVRAQLGPFKEAFVIHERTFLPEKVASWRKALKEAGKLSGVIIGKSKEKPDLVLNCLFTRDDEAAKLEEIVRIIQVGLDAEICLDVASFPVGLDSRLAELPSRLSDGSDDVYFLGIVGMGGVGKTSLAKAIYNKLFLHFKSASFLANVGGKSKELDYIVHLQQQLLVDTTNFKRAKGRITNVDMGNAIRRRLSAKKVLVVLDDVRDLDHIRKLAGGRDWFGRGSRIIVTTRDPDMLKAIHHVDDVYEVKPLNADESLQLFCGHAFRELTPSPTEDEEEFRRLSEQVLSYCKGIPLALEVLGGSLVGKTTDYWKNTLEQLKTIPDERIQARLEISYYSLGDRLQQLFLDIACFFVGWDKDYVVMVLEDCGLFAKKGIQDLIGKCLIEVDERNKLQMHDFTRDMGKEIIRRQSPNDPGERSRLWCHEDILTVLRSRLGTKKVEGIALNSSDSATYASATAFEEMKRLRLLQLDNLELHGEYGLISKELRLLHWHNFFNKFIPVDLYLEQLVAIDMQHNTLIEVFRDTKVVLKNLRSLNLSYSRSLTKTPNFSKFPNLERLILKYCTNLEYIDPSIGDLHKLVLMNFSGCTGLTLEKFPESIYRLKSLESFVFTTKMEEKKMEEKKCDDKAHTLMPYYYWVPTQERVPVHETGVLNKKQEFVPVHETGVLNKKQDFRIIPVFRLKTLKALKLISCSIEDTAIPADISGLVFLEYLDLRRNKFRSLPDTISHLPKLKSLKLDGCGRLEELPDMPPSLLCLSAVGCWSLRRISVPHFDYETRLFLSNCRKLRAIDGLQGRDRKGSIHLEECDSLEAEFREFLLKKWCGDGLSNVFLPGTDIPKWFQYRRRDSSSLSITIPPSWYGNLKDLTVCVIYSSDRWQLDKFPHPKVHIHPLNISYRAATNDKIALTTDEHMWVFHLPDSFFLGRLDSVNELRLDADFGVGWTVKGLGAYFPNKVGNPDECGILGDHFPNKIGNPDECAQTREYEDTYEVEDATSFDIGVVEEDQASVFTVLLCYSIVFGVCWMLWRQSF